jgi:chromosome segregation ATPase
MDVEAEIMELKRRMTVLENEVKADHEFSVKFFIYVREMRDDVALLRSHAVIADKRIERLEERMERLETSLAALRSDVNELRSEFNASRAEFAAFRKELPGMIAETMREVLREYRGR